MSTRIGGGRLVSVSNLRCLGGAPAAGSVSDVIDAVSGLPRVINRDVGVIANWAIVPRLDRWVLEGELLRIRGEPTATNVRIAVIWDTNTHRCGVLLDGGSVLDLSIGGGTRSTIAFKLASMLAPIRLPEEEEGLCLPDVFPYAQVVELVGRITGLSPRFVPGALAKAITDVDAEKGPR